MASNGEREPLLSTANLSASSGNYAGVNLNVQRVRIRNLRGGMLPGVIILFLVLLERIGFYSLTSNLYLYLYQSQFHWQYNNAINSVLIFSGISYLSSLFGGWLSDAYLGRFRTIGIAFILFSGAYWFMPFVRDICPDKDTADFINLRNASDPESVNIALVNEQCSEILIPILVLAAIGTGTVKANIAPFGAEQMRLYGADGLKLYLNWLYWCVNIGAFIAIVGITYVQQDFLDGFEIGYIIAATLLTAAALIFWFTFPIYVNNFSFGSSISRIFEVLKEAWKLSSNCDNSSIGSINRPSWLDLAKVRYGGKYHESVVEDVKSLSTILKVFLALIPYWLLYFQMQSTFLAQGLKLRLSFNSSNETADGSIDKINVPAAWLMLFNVIFLIIFIPLMNQVIYPCLKKRNIEISMLTRMAIGMVCAFLSMVIAGCLEMCRNDFFELNRTVFQTIDNTTYKAANLSIWWQIPQYSLIGVSEVFTSVSGLEFACSQAPSSMQGAVMGLYYFCNGVGSFLGAGTLNIYKLILSKHVNIYDDFDLTYYFFFLASLQLFTLVIFCCISKNLKIRKPPSSTEPISGVQGNSSRILKVG